MNEDIILSSRIRLARNVDGMPFRGVNPASLHGKAMEALRKTAMYTLYPMTALSPLEQTRFVERHLISKELISYGGSAIIREDNKISVMIGEEDHVRAQCIMKGLSLSEAYEELLPVEATLNKAMNFAYSPTFGYLTACLTNVGTGMRASVMMFLPALTLTGSLSRCINNVSRLNMAVRGVYGEGSQAEGYVYQISNQRTLGVSEREIVSSVENVATHLVDSELKAREALMQSDPDGLKDRILRSYGTLTSCYRMSKSEFMELIAFVKLGIYYKMFECTSPDELEKFITDIQPASLCLETGRRLDGTERDVVRAKKCLKLKEMISSIGG